LGRNCPPYWAMVARYGQKDILYHNQGPLLIVIFVADHEVGDNLSSTREFICSTPLGGQGSTSYCGSTFVFLHDHRRIDAHHAKGIIEQHTDRICLDRFIYHEMTQGAVLIKVVDIDGRVNDAVGKGG
jgi:hypothetical protein